MCVFLLLLLNLSFKFIFQASVMGFILSDVFVSFGLGPCLAL